MQMQHPSILPPIFLRKKGEKRGGMDAANIKVWQIGGMFWVGGEGIVQFIFEKL